MKIIVITLPVFIPDEAGKITTFLQERGMDLVHIRKLSAAIADVEHLISQIPPQLYSRLVLHDHFSLAQKYHLHGVHLNSRNPQPPLGWQGSISRSCHSLEEVEEWKPRMSYVSLSPIFDSISKQGYKSAFTERQLARALERGTIDSKVYALGGITFSRLAEVREMGFGGAMILGDAWKNEE